MPVATFFTKTIGIVRTNETRDEIGGVVVGTASTTPVSAYIEPVSGTEDPVNRNTPVGEWVAFVPPATDVGQQDRITFDGRVFDIESVEPFQHPLSGGLDHLRLRLREVT